MCIRDRPQTFIAVVPDLNVTEIGVKKITLQNLTITEPGEITAFLPVAWDSTYTGNKTLTEQVLYSMNNGPWVLFDTKTHLYPHGPELMLPTQYTDYASLDVKKLPPGGYKIRVYATSPDAPDTMAETLSLIHISEPTRRTPISYAVFCLKKKKNNKIT